MELNQALDEHDGHESPSILPDGEPIFTRDQADAFWSRKNLSFWTNKSIYTIFNSIWKSFRQKKLDSLV